MERELGTKVRFFVEEHPENLRGEPRHQVLSRILTPETCQYLEERSWGIALAIIEINPETAQIIKSINQDFPNLPITAWIVLPDSEGYWTNQFNVPQTRQKVEEVKGWANFFDLSFEAIAFDLESPLELVKAFANHDIKKILHQLKQIRRLQREHKLLGYQPKAEMEDLVRSLRREKIMTHSYEMPGFLSLPLFGVLQTKDFDIRVTMVYSSQGLPAFIESWIPTLGLKNGTFPAIGVISSTGRNPGRDLGENNQTLIEKHRLLRDIRSLTQKAARDRSQIMSNLWVFTLTDLEVAKWTKEALEKSSQ